MFSEQMKGLKRQEASLIQTDMCYINIMLMQLEIYTSTSAPASIIMGCLYIPKRSNSCSLV